MSTGGRKNRELILEDEGSTFDYVVEGEEALESYDRVSGAVEAVHEGFNKV